MDRIEEIVRAMWAARDPLTGEYDDAKMMELGKEFFQALESEEDEAEPDEQEDLALFNAVKEEDIEELNRLLAHGAFVDCVNERGETPLMWAAGIGNLEFAKVLIEHGSEVNLPDNYNVTALMQAVLGGNIDVVKLLLDHGADVNVKAIDHWTALSAAFDDGHTDIAELLKSKGAVLPDDLPAPQHHQPKELAGFCHFEVGSPFPRPVPPVDAAHYNYDLSGHGLTILLRNPTAQEIEDVKSGDLQFGLVVYGSVIILLHKMGGSPWSDAPYSWHLVPEENRQIPPVETLTPETRALLHIVLVDSVTGIIKAQRVVTFSPQFTKSLHIAITEQSKMSNARYDAEVDGLFARYTSRQLLGLAQAKCKISRGKEDV